MTGEFCLMRGVDEGCLLSLSEMPNGTCLVKAATDNRVVAITCPIESLMAIESGGSAHLAGPDGLCAIERDRASVRFRFITSDRRTRSFEVETPRFDAAVAMLAAGLSYASLS
jgi:hypothetical protein